MSWLEYFGIRRDKKLEESWGKVQASFDNLVWGWRRIEELLVKLHKLNDPRIEKLFREYNVGFEEKK